MNYRDPEEQAACINKLRRGFNIDYNAINSPCELYRQIYNRRFINSPYFLKLRRSQFEQELRDYVENPLAALKDKNQWQNRERMIAENRKYAIFVKLLRYITDNELSGVDKLTDDDVNRIGALYTDYLDIRTSDRYADDFDADYLIANLAKLYL